MQDGEAAHAQIVRKAGVVSLAVLFSRVTGLARETIFAAVFGAGLAYDAFLAAFRVPNLLRDLLAEGALSAAFVTTYSQTLVRSGPQAARDVSNRLTTLLVPLVGGICVLGTVAAPLLVALIFPGYAAIEGKHELTVLLTRVMMPFLLFVALAAKAMGVLNSHGKYGIPALASGFFNIASVGSGLFAGFVIGPELGIRPIVGMAVGMLMGGAVQYLCQLPSLRATGLRYRFEVVVADPGVRQVLRLMGPAAIAAAAVDVNVLVNSVFASRLTDASGAVIDGPVSWLGYAFRFMQLPLALFGVAVASATLPSISRAAGAGKIDEFRETLSRSLGLVFLMTLPSAVGLFVLSRPVVGVVFQRGQFTSYDTEQTALALSFYCLGLVGYASAKVLTPAFYALDEVRKPMLVSLLSILTNLGLNTLFIDVLGWGHWALALSTSVIATLNFLLLLGWMCLTVRGIEGRRLLAGLLRIALAAAAMGVCCWAVAGAIESALGPGTFIARLAALAVSVPLSVGVLYGICRALRIPELDLAQRAILQRLR